MTDIPDGRGLPSLVGVIGGGRMGAGIAHAFTMAGASVVVIERDRAAASAARDRVVAAIERSVERGAEPPEADRLAVTLDWDALGGAGLAIEAVPEVAALKAEALGRAERLLDPSGVLASNTSSLSIDGLATGLERPGAFLGLHFFNPVPASALVEVVTGSATAPTAVADATGWVEALGKTAVIVRDSPGFASSRLGVLLGLEAIRMVEEGVATPEDIDRAMTLGYRHPVGPLRLTDIVGLDVRLDIAEHLFRELGPRFEPPGLLRRMVADGRLGRKTGRGFYPWPDEGGDR
ncbi:3-hydroxyacyl-CoA dehydrogenase family protein [Leifsonia sp. F6_8S_P_1B]|uniref:3-hydroxyacyl-CoA dehydrogenase family protein n=1 Tax=Leifsonia williamsii TaxID=3035919 RepID=A0ABT8KEX9_9MICO|nr:3-hydroxyacyl-CoA dehydrogenase family protein [Leifsonia williamsii]MDN4616000.1 3-hydroxyacyl-CoA dehydrogenase family protein [Leifsonia williamsii]